MTKMAQMRPDPSIDGPGRFIMARTDGNSGTTREIAESCKDSGVGADFVKIIGYADLDWRSGYPV